MNVAYVAKLVRELIPEQRARAVHVAHGFDVYVGCDCAGHRDIGWGNPFHGKGADHDDPKKVEDSVRKYAVWLLSKPHLLNKVGELRGKRLGCWCRRRGQDKLCHALILVALADAYDDTIEWF